MFHSFFITVPASSQSATIDADFNVRKCSHIYIVVPTLTGGETAQIDIYPSGTSGAILYTKGSMASNTTYNVTLTTDDGQFLVVPEKSIIKITLSVGGQSADKAFTVGMLMYN